MNIELIKSELEKLTLMLSSWQSEEEVSAIERDIALDKLKSLYDMIRFGAEPSPAIATTPDVETAEEEEEERESDVEIELLFAEEDEIFTTTPEPIEDTEEAQTEEATEEQTVAAQSFAAEVLASAIGVDVFQPEVEISEPMPEKEAAEEVENEPETEVEPTPMPTMEPIAPIVEPEPEPEPKPESEPETESEPSPISEEGKEAVASNEDKEEETPTLNNLFGIEEIKPRPRTKHQRMMSIYDDNPSQHEKVVDISKIFDMDIDAPKPMTSPTIEREVEPEPEPIIIAEPIAEPEPAPIPSPVYEQEDEEPTMTLADAMANPKQTLADTIVTPTALGDDMNHAKIRSLREGIGLNDKFLMIRDLFDGDNEAYDEAISALDELESMDDCMIHIIENYAWNPDSEGSKFIMQLLERKLS